MLFSLLYFLVRRLLGAGGRLQYEKEVELLLPRHQVNVLQRQVKRPRLNRLDRVFLAAASRAMTRSSWASFVSVAADAPVPAADALVLSLTRHRSVHPRRSGRTCDAA